MEHSEQEVESGSSIEISLELPGSKENCSVVQGSTSDLQSNRCNYRVLWLVTCLTVCLVGLFLLINYVFTREVIL